MRCSRAPATPTARGSSSGLPCSRIRTNDAQRLQETGFGRRLPAYDWTEDQLVSAVDELLADDDLVMRMHAISAAVHVEPGRVNGADLIERVAVTGEPVTA